MFRLFRDTVCAGAPEEIRHCVSAEGREFEYLKYSKSVIILSIKFN
jgi:hypothetical protein